MVTEHSLNMKHGDFSELAEHYAAHRPGYSKPICDAILKLSAPDSRDRKIVDVGAGTGIWTRILADRTGAPIIAIEPNDDMRHQGMAGNGRLEIRWQEGSAEETGLPDNSCDLLTMASSFHWADLDSAVAEFQRVVFPGGWFAALWNPRNTDIAPIFVEIEEKLRELLPNMKRVSSGRSEFCDSLYERLERSPAFSEVLYLEGRHTEIMTPERYIGIWKSVNDVQVQLGPERFAEFLEYLDRRLLGVSEIEAHYTTRAWLARFV